MIVFECILVSSPSESLMTTMRHKILTLTELKQFILSQRPEHAKSLLPVLPDIWAAQEPYIGLLVAYLPGAIQIGIASCGNLNEQTAMQEFLSSFEFLPPIAKVAKG